MKRWLISVLVVASAALAGAKRTKSVEERYTAPASSGEYDVTATAPQVLAVGARAELVITVRAKNAAELGPIECAKLEAHAPEAVTLIRKECTSTARSPKELTLRMPLSVARRGTHELVVGIPVSVKSTKAPALVALPLSITGETAPASNAGTK